MVSFSMQKLFSLIKSYLFIFAFISFIFRRQIKRKVLLWFMSKRVLPMFSSSFMICGLIFRSLIHFEFIFVYGVREHPNFILLHVAVQFYQCHLLKRSCWFYLWNIFKVHLCFSISTIFTIIHFFHNYRLLTCTHSCIQCMPHTVDRMTKKDL